MSLEFLFIWVLIFTIHRGILAGYHYLPDLAF